MKNPAMNKPGLKVSDVKKIKINVGCSHFYGSGRPLLLVFLWLICSIQGYAQKNEIIEDKVVIIEKEAKLELPIASRNFQKIQLNPVPLQNKPQQYKYNEVSLELPKLPARIKVPTIPPDPLSKLYGNYVKAGFGNYATPYLEGFFNSKRSDNFNYGVHLKHLSSGSGPVKSDRISSLSSTSWNEIGTNVKYFKGSTILKAALDFNSRGIKYYGFDQRILTKPGPLQLDADKLKDSIKQRYNIFALSAGIENKDNKEALNYDLGVNYFHFNDRFKAKESEFLVNGELQYKLEKEKAIHLKGLLSFSKRKDSSSISRTFFILKPSYVFTKDNIKFRAGFNIAYVNDTLSIYDKFHFYPSVHAEYTVMEKELTAFAGVDGEMQKNTLRTFVNENPYLGSNLLLYNTNKALEIYAGGKGNLLDKINYLVKLSYINYKNLYFFNNSLTDTSRFAVYYAHNNTGVVNFKLDISYEMTDKFRFGLSNDFYGYSIAKDSIQAWHKPNVKTTIYGMYNLYDKIYVNADFYYISGLKGRNFISGKGADNSLPAIADLNLKVDYRVSPVFSAFIELNNLLAKKYQLYQYYPVKGINILAGISYSF
jgi:hypothetical protein